MNKFLTMVFVFGASLLISGAEPVVSVQPDKPSAGMTAELSISSGDGMVDLGRLPKVDGIRWNPGISSETSEIVSNGRSTRVSTVRILFQAEKEGSYEIPSIPITVNGKSVRTKPFAFQVTPPPDLRAAVSGKKKDLSMFAVLSIPGDKKMTSCYVGEEIPLAFQVFFRKPLKYEVDFSSYPAFEPGKDMNVLFRDYRKKDPRAPNFESARPFEDVVDGVAYAGYDFRTRFRPLSAGNLTIQASWPIVFMSRRGFFSAPEGSYTFRANLEPLTVRSLPPLPGGMPPFCGLVGDWLVRAELSSTPCRIGEPMTLKIRFEGADTSETLNAPAADFAGFRTYPPEIERSASTGECEIRYTLLPLKTGELPLRFALSTFDPVRGEYKPFVFERTLNAEKALALVQSPKTYVDAGTKAAESEVLNPQKSEDVLYLHKDLSRMVKIPLWQNALTIAIGLLVLGFMFFIFSVISTARQSVYEGNPALVRRRAAKKQKRALIRKIRETPPERLPEITASLSDYLNDTLDLPPGAGLSDASKQFNEERTVEFSDALQKLSDASWMPDTAKNFTPEFKQKLLKGFARFAVLALLFVPQAVSGADAAADVSAPLSASSLAALPDSPESAMAAYDAGDFEGALRYYSSELKKSRDVSPSLLYNMGNCYFKLGELSRSMVCYERALRLAPRDSDILENLNLVRSKLLLGEKYVLEHPADIFPYLRDCLRLDEWLILGAFSILLVFAAFSVRLRWKKYWKVTLGIGLALLLVSAAAAVSQSTSVLSPCYAVAIERNTPVYSLPSEKNARTEHHLKSGQEVRVEERRLGWARIRTGGDEGWVRESQIVPLWDESFEYLCPPEVMF